MKFKLLEFDKNASYFSSLIENREEDKRFLPCRAFRKTTRNFYNNYVNEVLIPIRKEDLPRNKQGYEDFNKTIEHKLRGKSVKDKINIITFFGEKTLNLREMMSFEDINLLADFEQRYNDHLISFPFTLKFRKEDYLTDKIFEDIKKTFTNFVSTLQTTNILGYVPAQVSHRSVEKFIKLYLDIGFTIKTPVGKKNFIPLLIDCKNSTPDRFKRTLAKLRRLKLKYLKEGYYLFYYGFSLGCPRVGGKKNIRTKIVAKDFLLSFLGFDIIGASHARTHVGGGGGKSNEEKVVGKFDLGDFNYHLARVQRKKSEEVRKGNLSIQTEYLDSLSRKLKGNREIVTKELKKRKEADKYIENYK